MLRGVSEVVLSAPLFNGTIRTLWLSHPQYLTLVYWCAIKHWFPSQILSGDEMGNLFRWQGCLHCEQETSQDMTHITNLQSAIKSIFILVTRIICYTSTFSYVLLTFICNKTFTNKWMNILNIQANGSGHKLTWLRYGHQHKTSMQVVYSIFEG